MWRKKFFISFATDVRIQSVWIEPFSFEFNERRKNFLYLLSKQSSCCLRALLASFSWCRLVHRCRSRFDWIFIQTVPFTYVRPMSGSFDVKVSHCLYKSMKEQQSIVYVTKTDFFGMPKKDLGTVSTNIFVLKAIHMHVDAKCAIRIG